MLHIYIIYIFGAANLEPERKRRSLLQERLAPLERGPGDLLFCLGVEAQRNLPNPDAKGKRTAASNKASVNRALGDQLA